MGLDVGTRVLDNEFRGGTSYTGLLSRAYSWCDTCLGAVVKGNYYQDGGLAIRMEVNQGSVVAENTIVAAGYKGIFVNSRADSWMLYDFSQATNLGTKTLNYTNPGGYNHLATVQPPVAGSGVTLAQDNAQTIPLPGGNQTGVMHVTDAGTVAQKTPFFWQTTAEDTTTTATSASYSCALTSVP